MPHPLLIIAAYTAAVIAVSYVAARWLQAGNDADHEIENRARVHRAERIRSTARYDNVIPVNFSRSPSFGLPSGRVAGPLSHRGVL